MLRLSLRTAQRVTRPALARVPASSLRYSDVKKPLRAADDVKPVSTPADVKVSLPADALSTKVSSSAADVKPTASQAAKEVPPVAGLRITPAPPPPPSSTTTSDKGTPKKRGFLSRLLRPLFLLALLSSVGFAGGVWLSHVNDNFHDFFTEYVPFGEEAVLYLEERELKKTYLRSPAKTNPSAASTTTVPGQSGASWRVATPDHSPRQAAAVDISPVSKYAVPEEDKETALPPVVVKENRAKDKTVKKEKARPKSSAVEASPSKKEVAETAAAAAAAASVTSPPSSTNVTKSDVTSEFKAPEVNEPHRMPPIPQIQLLDLPEAKEAYVQHLVRMVNDLITVVNADNAQGRYQTSIAKAKEAVQTIIDKMEGTKATVEAKSAQAFKEKVDAFEQASDEMAQRVEAVMHTQEVQWRRDFEAEVQVLKQQYDEKVATLLDRERAVYEAKADNRLLDQAVRLQKQFQQQIGQLVEQEREGRLSKLQELSTSVADLKKLTSQWNEVIDAHLHTQQLHIAVQAVRASLENDEPSAATGQSKPFVMELVALKEITAQDPIVDAAIASIHPSAYQRGVANTAQLIERFHRVAREVRKAALIPDDAGVASHASSVLLSKLLFRRPTAAALEETATATATAVPGVKAGADVEATLARAQTFLERGDLDAAAREVNGLSGWAKSLSRDWLTEVRKVLEVRQALEVIATEARLQSLRLDQD